MRTLAHQADVSAKASATKSAGPALEQAGSGQSLASSPSLAFGSGRSTGLPRLGGLQRFEVATPGTSYERQADRTAHQVMTLPAPAKTWGHGKAESGGSSVGSSASAMSRQQRSFFEPRFGHSFADVRIHSDERASRSADVLAARAFTIGNDIFMGRGELRPHTRDGQRLLAHELTHVVQQSGSANASTRAGRRIDLKPKGDGLVNQWLRSIKTRDYTNAIEALKRMSGASQRVLLREASLVRPETLAELATAAASLGEGYADVRDNIQKEVQRRRPSRRRSRSRRKASLRIRGAGVYLYGYQRDQKSFFPLRCSFGADGMCPIPAGTRVQVVKRIRAGRWLRVRFTNQALAAEWKGRNGQVQAYVKKDDLDADQRLKSKPLTEAKSDESAATTSTKAPARIRGARIRVAGIDLVEATDAFQGIQRYLGSAPLGGGVHKKDHFLVPLEGGESYRITAETRSHNSASRQVLFFNAFHLQRKQVEWLIGPDSLQLFLDSVAEFADRAALPNTSTGKGQPSVLRSAPMTFKGVQFTYAVNQVPYTEGTPTNFRINSGPFLLAPHVIYDQVRNPHVVYYLAYHRASGIPAYFIGPESVGDFIANVDKWNTLGGIVYFSGYPAPHEIEEAKVLNALMQGDVKGAAAHWSRAWKAAFKDPNWWLQMGMAVSHGKSRVPKKARLRVVRSGGSSAPRPAGVKAGGPSTGVRSIGPSSPSTAGPRTAGSRTRASAGGRGRSQAARRLEVAAPRPQATPKPVTTPKPKLALVVSNANPVRVAQVPRAVGAIGVAVVDGTQTAADPQPLPQPAEDRTGNNRHDPIPMLWYKLPSDYPPKVRLEGKNGDEFFSFTGGIHTFELPNTDVLTRGGAGAADLRRKMISGSTASFGVNPVHMPTNQSVWQKHRSYRRALKGASQRAFRFLMITHGHDMKTRREDADHVQDLQFTGVDDMTNMWPLNKDINQSARSFARQIVRYRDATGTAQAKPLDDASLLHKWFQIVGFRHF